MLNVKGEVVLAFALLHKNCYLLALLPLVFEGDQGHHGWDNCTRWGTERMA